MERVGLANESLHSPDSVRALQIAVREWADRVFGLQPAYRPALGIGEELGELAEALVAEPSEALPPAARDAVGDLMIFMADLSNRSGWDLAACILAGMETDLGVSVQQLSLRHLDAAVRQGSPVPRSLAAEPHAAWATSLLVQLGRLFRGLLKAEQGIRGPASEHESQAKIAAGAFVLALADLCARRGAELGECVEDAWRLVSRRDYRDGRQLPLDLPPSAPGFG